MSYRKLIITMVILLAGLFVPMTGSGKDGAGADKSSGKNGKSALESSEWRNGAFTFVIKEAILKGGAKDSTGKITAKSLRGYVLDRVEQLTDEDQTPMVCRDIAGRDFIVGE